MASARDRAVLNPAPDVSSVADEAAWLEAVRRRATDDAQAKRWLEERLDSPAANGECCCTVPGSCGGLELCAQPALETRSGAAGHDDSDAAISPRAMHVPHRSIHGAAAPGIPAARKG